MYAASHLSPPAEGFFKATIEAAAKKAREEVKTSHVKEIGGSKNGKVRTVDIVKEPKWCPWIVRRPSMQQSTAHMPWAEALGWADLLQLE